MLKMISSPISKTIMQVQERSAAQYQKRSAVRYQNDQCKYDQQSKVEKNDVKEDWKLYESQVSQLNNQRM